MDVRQVFVVEHGYRAATGREHAKDLLHEILARKKVLALLVPWIITMFANQDHTVHRKLAATAAERQIDGRVDRHIVLRRELRADVASPEEAVFHRVALRTLVDVYGHEVDT